MKCLNYLRLQRKQVHWSQCQQNILPDSVLRLKICKDNDLKEGSAKSLKVFARNVAVFRLNGALYGLEADCKHMRASIAYGKIEGTIITCPAHGWRYDITTGECLTESWAKLKTYPVEVTDGIVYIEI